MIGKAGTEYYNLEKVAEVLSVPAAEVNRLREQSKLRGFRDGSNWKFLKEEVHTYLAESIKARSGTNDNRKPGDSDFDLGGTASPSSFDVLVEDAALPDDSDLISVAPARPASDLDLAALDNDELSLAEETQISPLIIPKKMKPNEPVVQVVQDDGEDSSALVLAESENSGIIVDESSVLEAGKSSPQLGLAGDSGFDVIVAGEDENNILFVAEEKTEVASPIMQEFELEPSPQVLDDDSESSSQVIAIDAFAESVKDADSFGHGNDFGAFPGFDSDLHQTSPSASAGASDPFGASASAFPETFTAPVASVSSSRAAVPAEEYSTGMLIALALACVVMLFTGVLLFDTMQHMWSWSEPFMINSFFMDQIANLFGL